MGGFRRYRMPSVCLMQTSGESGIYKEINTSCLSFCLQWGESEQLGSQTAPVYSAGMPSTFEAAGNLCGPVYQSWAQVYRMCTGAGSQTFPIESQLCVSQILWNGFSAHVKGNGWCLSAPVIWKIQFKRMRERMVHGLFSFPHTERYENDVLLCGGNDANRTAEKFLHNSIQFLLNPDGKLLCQRAAEWRRQKGRAED